METTSGMASLGPSWSVMLPSAYVTCSGGFATFETGEYSFQLNGSERRRPFTTLHRSHMSQDIGPSLTYEVSFGFTAKRLLGTMTFLEDLWLFWRSATTVRTELI